MLISALLGLLRHLDVTRANVEAKKEVKTYEEVAATAMPAITHETGNAHPETGPPVLPPIAEESPPRPPDSNVEYACFIKAVDRLVKKPCEHSLDVFE